MNCDLLGKEEYQEGKEKRGKEKEKRKKEKIQTSSNTGEIGRNITSDSELDFPFQP